MNPQVTTLSNGLTVATDAMPDVRSVALGIWIKVGSRDEAADQAGMAHFMEHMLFKGTPAHSAIEISELFDELGAESNAFTSKEYTCLHARFVDEKLPEVLPLMAEMLIDSKFADEDILTEREVVLEEIARSEDAPDDKVFDLFSDAMMPTHALGRPVLGSPRLVGAYTHDDCQRFHDEHYGTRNLVVAAAGNVDHEQLVGLAQRCFARMPQGTPTQRPVVAEEARRFFVCEKRDTEQAHLAYGFPWMDARDPRRFAGALTSAVLGGSASSRLFQEVREKSGLAYTVFSQGASYTDAGQFCVYCGTRPDNLQQTLDIVRRELARMVDTPPTQAEVARQCGAICGSLLLSVESTSSRMARLGRALTMGLPLHSVDELVEVYRSLTPADVQKIAGEFFTQKPTVAVVSGLDADTVKDYLD
jgi:predicted Zn-dependent peptidase